MQADNTPVRLLVAFANVHADAGPSYLLQAPGRKLWLAAILTDESMCCLRSVDAGGRALLNYQSIKVRQTMYRRPLPWWAHYPAGVIKQLYERGMDRIGVDVLFVSEEPRGPGLDYALGIGFGALWHEMHGQPYTPQSLIELVDEVRREYIENL